MKPNITKYVMISILAKVEELEDVSKAVAEGTPYYSRPFTPGMLKNKNMIKKHFHDAAFVFENARYSVNVHPEVEEDGE